MFKNEKIMTLRVLAVLIAISAIIASITGIVFPDIYKPIVSETELPFNFAQDFLSLITALLLLVLTLFVKNKVMKLDILRTGLAGYLLYVYGQYVMGTVYNYSYYLYLSIFGLSIFYLINAFSAIEYEKLEFAIPKSLRIITAVYCAAITIYFAPQWIMEIFHNIQTNSRTGADGVTFNHYVYILDLCFILPVCVVSSVLLLRKKNSGILLGGILSIFGFILMLWVALGVFCHPLFHKRIDVGGGVLFSIISFVFLILSVSYFVFMKVRKTEMISNAR